MSSKLYVGNLPFSVTDTDLNTMFAKYGTVNSVNIITDKYTNRSRGFAFVEMETDEAAQKAIAELNDTEIDGRKIIVNQARPQEPRRERSFGKRGERSGRTRRW
ncbi:MAG: RNA-binding protein [candidate division WOR-3 bacterium]